MLFRRCINLGLDKVRDGTVFLGLVSSTTAYRMILIFEVVLRLKEDVGSKAIRSWKGTKVKIVR